MPDSTYPANEVEAPRPSSMPPPSTAAEEGHYQGVLYKRRDVFHKRWRPRWFVLHPSSGVLTYYLLTHDDARLRNSGRGESITTSTLQNAAGSESARNRTTSVDYEVVPRGTIYLPGSRVAREESLSKDGWKVFSISPPDVAEPRPQQQKQPVVYLSTTSETSRSEWIQKLTPICGHELEEENSGSDTDGQDEETEEADVTMVSTDEEVNNENDGVHFPGTYWRNVEKDDNAVLESVPGDVASRIQSLLSRNLRFACSDAGWNKTLEIPNGITSYQRKDHHHLMIKSVGILRHHPKQLFNLLIDVRRRRDFENNVKEDERLKQYNKHTYLDCYTYRAVWPTSAREFGVVVHWRVLEADNHERAICIVAYSDPVVDELRPPASDRVRANLLISLTLLRLHPNVDGDDRCHVTRLLSYDLCGSVPKSLTSTIMQQQATIPVVLTQHLTATEPNPPERLKTGELTHESVIRDVIDHLGTLESSIKRRLKFEAADEEKDQPVGDSYKARPSDNSEENYLSITFSAIILMTPLVLWHFAALVSLPGKELYFVVAAVLAIRAVVLSHLGRRLEYGLEESSIGRVTCRLSVDLKGVLQLIANRKEELEEDGPDALSQVSIIHIVLMAIAKAMKEVEALKSKHAYMPLLGIDGYYLHHNGSVDVSLLTTNHHNPHWPEDAITLKAIESLTVDDIAKRIEDTKQKRRSLQSGQTRPSWSSYFFHWLGLPFFSESLGSCIVVASPDVSDHAEVDIDVAPLGNNMGACIAVVVGGIRLVRNTAASSPSPRGKKTPPPLATKPTLLLSVSIDCPICSVQACRQFAERLQELIEAPCQAGELDCG